MIQSHLRTCYTLRDGSVTADRSEAIEDARKGAIEAWADDAYPEHPSLATDINALDSDARASLVAILTWNGRGKLPYTAVEE